MSDARANSEVGRLATANAQATETANPTGGSSATSQAALSTGTRAGPSADTQNAPLVDTRADPSTDTQAGPSANPPADPSADAPAAPRYALGLTMPPARAAACFLTAAVLALAQGFSQSLVSSNAQQLQGYFGTTQAETLWFTAAFMAPNVSLTLALIKLRGQFGLRRFAEISIVVFLLSGLLSFLAEDFWSHMAVRFLAGCAAAPMSSLAFLYMLDPLPQQRKMNVGLAGALTLIFMGSTLTRLVSPPLIDLGSWPALTMLEAAMAAIGLCLIYRFPLLNPAMPMKIEPADVVSFLLIAVGFGCLAVAAITGAQYWWTEQAWLGWLLVTGVATLALAAAIELNRDSRLLDIRWLASPVVLHFAATLLLFRLILSEQSAGAAGLIRSLGLLNAQASGLWLVVLGATVAGGVICALWMKPGREKAFHAVALVLLIAGSLMDSRSTAQTLPSDLYLSQAMIGLAAALFLPPAMLSGLLLAFRKGPDYILTFIVVFLTTQKIGGFLGGALFSTLVQVRTALHGQRLSEALAATDPLVTERIATYAAGLAPVVTDPTLRQANAAAQLASAVQTQAAVMAYNDAFLVVAGASAVALVLLAGHAGLDALQARRARQEAAAAHTPHVADPPRVRPQAA
ncbi:MFS transporter [Marinibacterium sp. SX1]|uniref:MFS transporter n=1 Tax=Marinibacterium sp. SX1 TaxID=3388424 RepID=UPI003D164632